MLNGVLLVTTLIILCLILEWFIRFTGIVQMTARTPHLYRESAIAGVNYEFLPNLKNVRGYNWESISTNSLGFRGPELDSKKPTIAVIGDSMTWGYGVPDGSTNPDQLRKAFPDYNVLNTGVNGYNVEQEVQMYTHKFADLHPALAVIEFYWNDMERPPFSLMHEGADTGGALDVPTSSGAHATDLANRAQAMTKAGTLRIPGKVWMNEHSALFRFIEQRTKWLPFRAHGSFDYDAYLRETITPDDLNYYRQWLTTLATNLGNTPRVFFIWPENAHLHREARAALAQMATDNGFTVIDMTDVLGMQFPTLSWNPHPDAATQTKVGQILAAFIQEQRLLDHQPPTP